MQLIAISKEADVKLAALLAGLSDAQARIVEVRASPTGCSTH